LFKSSLEITVEQGSGGQDYTLDEVHVSYLKRGGFIYEHIPDDEKDVDELRAVKYCSTDCQGEGETRPYARH
jgi:hypothetical protein